MKWHATAPSVRKWRVGEVINLKRRPDRRESIEELPSKSFRFGSSDALLISSYMFVYVEYTTVSVSVCTYWVLRYLCFLLAGPLQRIEAQLRDCRGTVMTQPESQVFYGFILHFVFTLTWKACDGRALSQQPDARFEIVRWDSTWQNVNAESWWPLRLVTETVLPRASRSSRSSSASPSSSARSRFTVLGCLLHSWHCEVCPTCGKPQAHQSKYKVELNKAFECTKININFWNVIILECEILWTYPEHSRMRWQLDCSYCTAPIFARPQQTPVQKEIKNAERIATGKKIADEAKLDYNADFQRAHRGSFERGHWHQFLARLGGAQVPPCDHCAQLCQKFSLSCAARRAPSQASSSSKRTLHIGLQLEF